MPLSPIVLENELRKFLDPNSPLITSDPIINWTNAMFSYTSFQINPPPINIVAARAAMSVTLSSGVTSSGIPISIIKQSLISFAGIIALTPPGIGIPPPIPPIIESVIPIGLSGADHYQTSKILANTIHLWYITGTWSIPPAPPILWS